MRNEDWALTGAGREARCHIDYEHHRATLTNGKIIAIVNQKDRLPLPPSTNLLQEFWRLRGEVARMNHLTASTSAHSTARTRVPPYSELGNIH
ncbi:hypothetical protein KCP71_01640 [Salmonella enterica subsp. enterica]|nr:hypothetical protein KCP71_01640 [Salmonella enterica subsp. enterica]